MFDLKGMEVFPYEQRDRNVFYEAGEFKLRLTELPPGGEIPSCRMETHVVFYVINGEAEVTVDGEGAVLREGQCLVTGPAHISMRTEGGVRLMGVQVRQMGG